MTIMTTVHDGYNQHVHYISGTGRIPYPSTLYDLNYLADSLMSAKNLKGNYNIVTTCWLNEAYEA